MIEIINGLSLIGVLLFILFGVFEYIAGPEKTKEVLAKIHFPLNYRAILFVGFSCLAIRLIIMFLNIK